MSFSQRAALLAACTLAICNLAVAADPPPALVVPSGYAALEGNSTDGGTFGTGGGGDFRMQTVISALEFTAYSSPFYITGISYRPDASAEGGGDSSGWSISPVVVSQRIVLSTTSKSVDGLSFTFSENTGSNAATVLNGSVSVSSANTLLANGTKAFDIYIPFTSWFLYDPSAGNLLIDSRTLSGGNLSRRTVDGVQVLGDSVSSVRTGGGNGDSPTAADGNTYATVFQLHLSPVPELSSAALLLAGLGGLLTLTRKSRTRSNSEA